MYEIDSDEGIWNSASQRHAEPRPPAAPEGGLLPGPADGHPPGPAQQDGPRAPGVRHRCRGPAPRGRRPRPGRDRHPLRDARRDRRQGPQVQVHRQADRPRGRQGRDVHAEAAVRRQRLGHAYPPESVEGRHEPLLRREGLRAAVRHGALVHRWAAAARQGGPGIRRADDQLVSPPGPGLRGADQPRLLAAQPLGVHPHPDVLHDAGRAPPRVPLARPDLQPVPVVQRPAPRRARRRHQQDRAADAGRRRHLRAQRRREGRHRRDARARSRRRSTRSRRTRSSCIAATSSRKDVVDAWLDFKRAGAKEVQLRPHPYEFYLYSEM